MRPRVTMDTQALREQQRLRQRTEKLPQRCRLEHGVGRGLQSAGPGRSLRGLLRLPSMSMGLLWSDVQRRSITSQSYSCFTLLSLPSPSLWRPAWPRPHINVLELVETRNCNSPNIDLSHLRTPKQGSSGTLIRVAILSLPLVTLISKSYDQTPS